MAEQKKVEKPKVEKKETKPKKVTYAITKSNGKVIYRNNIDSVVKKQYTAKGWKVKEM
tara:strand:- start:1623 stop:1796 length:174 start_codon:yes stop_codon:yes gene_type:complete